MKDGPTVLTSANAARWVAGLTLFSVVIAAPVRLTAASGGCAQASLHPNSTFVLCLLFGAGVVGALAITRIGRRVLKVLALVAVILVICVGVLAYFALFETRCATIEASAVGSLRTINTSEVTYSGTYSTGFSETLEQLGGEYDWFGYKFTYLPVKNPATGKVETFEVYADPVSPVSGNGIHYFLDSNGDIHETASASSTRRADSHDPLAEKDAPPPARNLRYIREAERSYASQHGRGGFTSSLTELGGFQSAEFAGLIDEVLAAGKRREYTFKYVSHRNHTTNKVESHELYADPQSPGHIHYFTDQSGVIRSTKEDRQANAHDPALAG